MDDDWCDFTERVPAKTDGKRPNHIRCPKCRRRLIPKTETTDGFLEPFEAYYVIPPHKKPHGKRPSKKKAKKKEKKGRIR